MKGPTLLQNPVMMLPGKGSAPDVVESDTDGTGTVQEEGIKDILEKEAERVEAERVEAERVDAERVEAERVEAESVDAVFEAEIVTEGCGVDIIVENPEVIDVLCK